MLPFRPGSEWLFNDTDILPLKTETSESFKKPVQSHKFQVYISFHLKLKTKDAFLCKIMYQCGKGT